MNRRLSSSLAALLFCLAGVSASAGAQTCTGLCLQQVQCPNPAVTTSISGTVYAPNGVDPLPNVLVYVPNSAVQPFTAGVACSVPVSGSPLVSTTTGADGKFVLANMPVGSNIPVVIQAGKWRRQLTVPSVAACTTTPVSAAASRFPKNQSEGDIPRIAVVTGSADATECVLRKIGIDDAEFTNPGVGGRISIYLGNGSIIDAQTPLESTLWSNQATLNQYDMTMMACQGNSSNPSAADQQRLVNYTNAGGRIFGTHYAYSWLVNNAPFSGVATWSVNQTSPANQTGFVDMTFPKGQQLAQWLQTVGASTTLGQIPLSALKLDQTGVVAPTKSWLTIGNPPAVMQFTFNTPVGTPAAQQCGRVLFNEYHVENSSTTGSVFPASCVAGAMTAQEKLLEFDLFDLTNVLAPDQQTVTYVGNGNTGGSVPVDGNLYANGATVTVLGNTGGLVKTGYTFKGWNTAADGTGTNYPGNGSTTFIIGVPNVVLYANWAGAACALDVDGNNTIDALTDGLMILRAMFGLTGVSVTTGAVGLNPTRADWTAIRSFLNGSCGTHFAQ